MKEKGFHIVVMLILMLVIPSLAVATQAGKVTHTEGKVDITKVGMPEARDLLPGEPIEVGDTVRTKSKSKAEITFSDDNVLRIAASSRVTIRQYMVEGNNTNGVMKLHRGMVQVISSVGFIKRLVAAREQNKMEVNTVNATCGIRGSNMIVSYHGGVTSVLFITGHGYTYNPAKPDVVVPITSGNISAVEKKDSIPTQPRPISEAEIDVKVKAVTPTEKAPSDREQNRDVKSEAKDFKDKGRPGDMHGVGKVPTDAADLPSDIAVTPPGQINKALDLKTADRNVKELEAKSFSPGKSGASKGGESGVSLQKGMSGNASNNKTIEYLKEKKEKKEKK